MKLLCTIFIVCVFIISSVQKLLSICWQNEELVKFGTTKLVMYVKNKKLKESLLGMDFHFYFSDVT